MSIPAFIKKVCKQTAIYWGNPVKDGFGGYTYDEPIEIKCRYEEQLRLRTSKDDDVQYHQKGVAMVTSELEIGGWVYFGYATEIEDPNNNYAIPTNPMDVKLAYQIIARDKVPLFASKDKFIHTIMFGFGNVQD